MTDYGHELQFGVFLTPVAAQADDLLALARAADAVGLDLVTVQDHPYQARFLDTWTLLSVIAAHTARVRVAPNVANLPLRPPVVLARSVASLDILSGGRAELGIGAGYFWDAIAAAGGTSSPPASRWTPSPRQSTSSGLSGTGDAQSNTTASIIASSVLNRVLCRLTLSKSGSEH